VFDRTQLMLFSKNSVDNFSLKAKPLQRNNQTAISSPAPDVAPTDNADETTGPSHSSGRIDTAGGRPTARYSFDPCARGEAGYEESSSSAAKFNSET
jgi:hypothetical protein